MSASLPLSPHLRNLPPYPFAKLDTLKDQVEARGIRVIDLSIGDVHEPVAPAVKRALLEAVPERSSYPRATGLPGLRKSVAGWVQRRFGVSLDPEREVLPTNGSKEAVYTLHLAAVDPKERPVVMFPDPAYPVYALGTMAAYGEAVTLPLRESAGYLPDLGAVPVSTWRRTAILWLNYPHNPTGAMAPLEFFREAAARCREHGVILASDEAYTELYYGREPHSALECGTENVIALHTLSKRSALPGYRSGFMAGDARLMDALKRFRPGIGTATPQFIQEAARAAWDDEEHVAVLRERFRERRDLVLDRMRSWGLEAPESPATIYVWFRIPGSGTSEAFVLRCLEQGLSLVPGSAMGPAGEGYARISLTVDLPVLEEALARLERVVRT